MDKIDVEYIRLEKAKKNGKSIALEQRIYFIREFDEIIKYVSDTKDYIKLFDALDNLNHRLEKLEKTED